MTDISLPVAAAMLLLSGSWTQAIPANGGAPTRLSEGLTLEQSLGGRDEHSYEVALQEGAAIVGEADQEGVDLVVDIRDPSGKLLASLDSPNGANGPEPFDFTATRSGLFRIVLRTADGTAAAGRYKLLVRQILDPAANADRLAVRQYPTPAILALWREYRTDPQAVAHLLADRKGKGPIVEAVPGDDDDLRITYLYEGDPDTEKVRVSGGPHSAVGGILMTRFLDTPLFYASEILPKDSRFTYGFASIEMHRAGAAIVSEDRFAGDRLNPHIVGGRPAMELPGAASQAYAAERPGAAKGVLAPARIQSVALNETRPISVYTPPGLKKGETADLLIVFDRAVYSTAPAEDGIPTPVILDNLFAEGRIRPTIALFVDNLPGRRDRDLSGNPAFADFVGKELVAWARAHYPIARGPAHVVAAGSSLGAVAAAYCALRHPDEIGNVLSQSGAYWVTAKGATWRTPYPYSSETGFLIGEFRSRPTLPIRFHMSIGRFEDAVSLLPANRELRDVLLSKNYQIAYEELDEGHEPFSWRGSLARGLVALLGKRERKS